MKALENSSETTLQIQVLVFSYGKLSTITSAGQLIASTFVLTLAEIVDPNVSANHAMARWLLEPLQSPDISTLISQSHMKSNSSRPLNCDNLGML
ncbi:hypothetical protein DVH24_002100 [Malus domestica]|uniref:Uncharacterized protein n=1 Tax=Malus domestica TaxID=3750 RepID=A0A498I8N6_MALDO|nr:hypothetical protein DVH24_002100 [Malus domestica]